MPEAEPPHRSIQRAHDGDPWHGSPLKTYYELLHGIVQHDAYHAGQIAGLKKVPGFSRDARDGADGRI